MERTIRQALIVGIGDTGIAVLSRLRERLVHLSDGKGVPVISLVGISENGNFPRNELPAGEEVQPIHQITLSARSVDDAVLQLLSPELQEAIIAMKPAGQSEASTRLTGWLKFFSNAPFIESTLRQWTLQVIDTAAKDKLKNMGMGVHSTAALDVFVVGALSDPFTSGTLVEFPYLLQHILEHQMIAERITKRYAGVLFLPVFADETHDGEDINERRKREYTQQANTYAALKELDYYMDQGHYKMSFDPGLRVEQIRAPYDYVYLVDAVNEANQRIPTRSQMTEMVAEWFDQTLTTTMGEELSKQSTQGGIARSFGKLAVYSGFGLSAYILPVEETIDVGAIRLGLDMLGRSKGLLKEQPPEAIEPVVFSAVDKDGVVARLRNGNGGDKKIAAYTNQFDKPFRHMAPYDLKAFFETVYKSFGHNYTRLLPVIERNMATNLEDLLDEKQKEVEDKAFELIDDNHIGGISLAIRALQSLTERLNKLVAVERGNLDLITGQLKEATEDVTKTQAAHVAAVYAFYPEDWREQIVVWGGLIGFLVFSFWLSITSFLFAKDNLAGLVAEWSGGDLSFLARAGLQLATFLFLIAALFAVGVAGYNAYHWWKRTRSNYVSTLKTRLTDALKKVVTSMTLHYFSAIERVSKEVNGQVVDLRDKVETVQDALQQRFAAPHALYGSRRFLLEESLLTEEDFDEFYEEIVGGSVEDELYRFSQPEQYGTISGWRDMEPKEIEDKLLAFGRGYLSPGLKEKDVETLLVKHAQLSEPNESGRHPYSPTANDEDAKIRAVQEKMKDLIDSAKPFLRYNSTALDTAVNPSLIQVVGFLQANNDDSLVQKAVEQIGIGSGATIQTVRVPDRYHIISMSVRHGLPLSAVSMLASYREQYSRFRARNEVGLHAQSKYLMLPDIFPLRFEGKIISEPQEAVALGLAFGKVHWNSRQKRYECQYHDNFLEKNIVVPLGEDKTAATMFLQEHVEILSILSEQIDEDVTRRSRQKLSVSALGDTAGESATITTESAKGIVGGNRSVIKFLLDYLEKNKKSRSKRKALADWEILVIEEYITKLRR